MIKVDHVGLTIKKTRILDDINLKLERGKIHGLVGRNGSGKTMLMKCICGFVRPTEGRVFVDGKQIGKDADFPESLGVIIETPEFIPSLSGYDNLRMLAGGRHRIGPDEIKAAMDLVELDWKMRLHVKKYSLGMRQRLGIAQALMESPDLLVLDEPLNGLDEDGAAKIRKVLMEKQKEGTTILIASHNSEDIRVMCHTVHRLYKGRILADETDRE